MMSLLARSMLRVMRPRRVELFGLLCRDQWRSAEQIEAESRRRLGGHLRYVTASVPFYREWCYEAGLDPAGLTADDLGRFPRVSKQDLMADPGRFRSAHASPEDLVPSSTGGSSGQPFHFHLDRNSLEARAANDLLGRTWTGWNLGDRQTVLWGHPGDNTRTGSLRGRFLGRFVHRTLNLDTFDMDDEIVLSYHRNLRDFRPAMILGYASALAFFAEFLTRNGLEPPPVRGIISSAETLDAVRRAAIEDRFDCKVLDRYGSREFGDMAQQCEVGEGYHVLSHRVRLEILRPDGRPCEPGERGEIVVTDLENQVAPFVRYRTGDLARPSPAPCLCGRGFPLLSSVEGRTSELICGANGKYYACPGPTWWKKGIEGIRQMQIVQDELSSITIRIVPEPGWDDSNRGKLINRMKELLGEIDVLIEERDEIPPSPSGKYTFTQSSVSPFDTGSR